MIQNNIFKFHFQILVTWSEAKQRLKKQIQENENDSDQYKELIYNIEDRNKNQFLEQDLKKGKTITIYIDNYYLIYLQIK